MRDDYMETDTPINGGNSGGPLLDINNKVIGVSSAIIQDNQNSSLIIPINILKKNLKAMLNSKKRILYKNVLGLTTTNGSLNYRKFYNMPNKCPEGIIIKKVLKKTIFNNKLNEINC
jgi:S1-C subfamily serine protease